MPRVATFVLLICTSVLSVVAASAQESSGSLGYYVRGEWKSVTIALDRIYISEPAGKRALQTVMAKHGIRISNSQGQVATNPVVSSQEKLADLLAALESEGVDAKPVLQSADSEFALTRDIYLRKAPSFSEADLVALADSLGLEPGATRLIGLGYHVFRYAGEDKFGSVRIAKALYEHPGILLAEPGFQAALDLHVVPNDSHFTQQWHLTNTGQTGGTPGADINILSAWDRTVGSSTVTVAVLDVGVDTSHPEFAGRLLPGYDALDGDNDQEPLAGTDDYHGTAVAGILAAKGNNSIGIAGAAWNVQILPIRVATSVTSPTQAVLADAIATAVVRGAHVINCSWSWGDATDLIDFAIQLATNQGRSGLGSIIVSSAGNAGGSIGYPANHPDVIAVGATDDDDVIEAYSNTGPEVDLVAPGGHVLQGRGIYTTDITGVDGGDPGDYMEIDGTSAAAPQVAGAGALVISTNPGLTALEVRNYLRNSAIDLGAPGFDSIYGAGRLDVSTALGQSAGIIAISGGTITEDTTWQAGPVYHVLGNVNVASGVTLTLEAGTIIKFSPYRWLSVYGTLNSLGTATRPVYFTSISDDGVGGDTNGDGASVGAPGDWGQVLISGGAYAIAGCEFRYGGRVGSGTNSNDFDHAVEILDFTGTINDVRIVEVYGYSQDAALYVGGTSDVSITNSEIVGGSYGVHIDSPATATINRVSVTLAQAYGIRATSTGPVHVANSRISDSPYGISLAAGAGSSVQADTVSSVSTGIDVASSQATIESNLVTDCSVGIRVDADGAQISANQLVGSSVGIYTSGSGHTISLNALTGFHYGIESQDNTPSISSNTFTSGGTPGYPFQHVAQAWPTYAGNTIDPAWIQAVAFYGSISSSFVLGNAGGFGWPYVVGNITVQPGGALTVPPGTALKFRNYSEAKVYGTLTAQGNEANPIIFTSATDDSVGGDSNGDGVSMGAPGDWGQLLISGGDYTLEWCEFKYGGRTGPGTNSNNFDHMLELQDFTGTVQDCRFYRPYGYNGTAAIYAGGASALTIERAVIECKNDILGAGIQVDDPADVTVRNTTIRFARNGVHSLSSGTHEIVHNHFVGQGDAGTGIYLNGFTSADVTSNDLSEWWTGIYLGGGVAVVDSNLVESGQTGVSLDGDSSQVAHNQIVSMAGIGISVEGDGHLVHGNSILNCAYGIRAFQNAPAITNNVFEPGSAGYAYYHYGHAWPSYSGNTVAGTWYPAIFLAGAVSENLLLGDVAGLGWPYVIGGLTVDSGDTLIIPAGTQLKAAPYATVTINGMLKSLGTSAEPVVFTCARDDSSWGDSDLNGETVGSPGQWGQVVINGGDYDLSWCEFKYGGRVGSRSYESDYDHAVELIDFNGGFRNNLVFAAYGRSGDAGLYIGGNGQPAVADCRIVFSYSVDGSGIIVEDTAAPRITDVTIASSRYGIYSTSTAIHEISSSRILGHENSQTGIALNNAASATVSADTLEGFSTGIACGNQAEVTGCYIQNCATGISITGDDGLIQSNWLYGDPSGGGNRGIQSNGFQHEISGNHIRDYAYGIWCVRNSPRVITESCGSQT